MRQHCLGSMASARSRRHGGNSVVDEGICLIDGQSDLCGPAPEGVGRL